MNISLSFSDFEPKENVKTISPFLLIYALTLHPFIDKT